MRNPSGRNAVLVGTATAPIFIAPKYAATNCRRVRQDDQDAVARLDPRTPQRVSGPVDQRGDFRIGVGAVFTNDSGPAAAGLGHVPVHKVGCQIEPLHFAECRICECAAVNADEMASCGNGRVRLGLAWSRNRSKCRASASR